MRRRRTTSLLLAAAVVLAGCAPATVVDRGPTGKREVTLTFDGAYDARFTGRILDVLRDMGVKATFFVTGEYAERFPDSVARMASEGHLVGNHSHSHPDFTTISDEDVADELALADAAVAAASGRSTAPYFRPPYGAQDARINQLLGAHGYRYDVLWTVDSLGWKGLSTPEVVARCIGRAAPGTIFMFHLGAPADLGALPWIIQWLRDQSYRIVRLDAWYR